jgi:hypothetical protein
MYTYFTVLRCIISVKILINGLFSYWILLTKKNDHTLLLHKIYYYIIRVREMCQSCQT